MLPNVFRNRLFDDFMGNFPLERGFEDFGKVFKTQMSNLMATDVKENESGYELAVDLPGYKKEDINLELDNGYLTIKATRNANDETKDENGKVIRKERFTGTTSRCFYVGDQLTEEDVKAKFDNGVLQLVVPKKKAEEIPSKKLIAIE